MKSEVDTFSCLPLLLYLALIPPTPCPVRKRAGLHFYADHYKL